MINSLYYKLPDISILVKYLTFLYWYYIEVYCAFSTSAVISSD